MIGLTYWDQKKEEEKKVLNLFCLSLPAHLLVFCEVEIGNAQRMCRGDVSPTENKVPLPRRARPRRG